MRRYLPALLIALVAAACAGTSISAWNKQSVSSEQWRIDSDACAREASDAPTPAGGWASYDADKLIDLGYAACLRGRGYRAVPLTDAQLSALSVASYQQRKSFEARFAGAARPDALNPLQGD
jgi:hypothetical protein